MFELQRFIADCRAARAADKTHKAVRDVVARAVAEPQSVLKGLGEPKRAEVQKLYHSPELTILNVVWAPHMTIYPHNHRTSTRSPTRSHGSLARSTCTAAISSGSSAASGTRKR